MVTEETFTIAITDEIRKLLGRKKNITTGFVGALEFPEQLYKALASPPESGRLRFGDYIVSPEETTKLLRAFREFDEMACYVAKDGFRKNLYTVYVTFENATDVAPIHKMFYFHPETPHPISVPE